MTIEQLTFSDALVIKAALATALCATAYVVIRKIASTRIPDPWAEEIDAAVRERDAVPICPDCLYPQTERSWFCPYCSFPAGEYVTLLPILQYLALGEAFRRGVSGPPENRKGASVLAFVASVIVYRSFAIFYWYWLVRKQDGKPICTVQHRVWNPDENA